MTVAELMQNLTRAFPLFTPMVAETWTPIFSAALKDHEGPTLAKSYSIVMQEFDPTPRKAYPMPKDFVLALTSRHPKIAAATGPALDFATHGERVRSILAEWWAGQGLRAAGNNEAIRLALMHMTEPLANVWGWAENPAPLRLTRGQVRIVQQRAISQERVKQFGLLPKDGAVWWEQIQSIAAAWGIETTYEEWAAKKVKPQTERA